MTCIFVDNLKCGIVIGADTRESNLLTSEYNDGYQKLKCFEFGYLAASGLKPVIESIETCFVKMTSFFGKSKIIKEAIEKMFFSEELLEMIVDSANVQLKILKSGIPFSQPTLKGTYIVLTVEERNFKNMYICILDVYRKRWELIEKGEFVIFPTDIFSTDKEYEHKKNQALKIYKKLKFSLFSARDFELIKFPERLSSSDMQKIYVKLLTGAIRGVSQVLDWVADQSRMVSKEHHIGFHLQAIHDPLSINYGDWKFFKNFTLDFDNSRLD